jgi:hypothetical protein
VASERMMAAARVAAKDMFEGVMVDADADVSPSPDGMWVQTWVRVPVCTCEQPLFARSDTDNLIYCMFCEGLGDPDVAV